MTRRTPPPTQERLRSLLDYDPATGVFRRRVTRSNRVAGSIAGRIHKVTGYRQIGVDGVRYSAHRLAWLYVYGEWPRCLDHKDGDRGHNAIDNLRPATVSQNGANRRLARNNTSGITGVSIIPNSRNKWRAQIHVGRKQLFLGCFETPEDAAAAYAAAARKHFGEFARTE